MKKRRITVLVASLMVMAMGMTMAGCTKLDGGEQTSAVPATSTTAATATTTTTEATTEATTETVAETTTILSDSETGTQGGAPVDLVVGNEADHNAQLSVKNGSGKTITEFYIKKNEDKEYEPDDLLATPWLADETRDVYLKVDTEKAYDIRIVYEDGTKNEMTRLYVAYISEGTIQYLDGKSFLEHEPIPQETETSETTKKPKATTTQDPNAGCIGDDGLFY